MKKSQEEYMKQLLDGNNPLAGRKKVSKSKSMDGLKDMRSEASSSGRKKVTRTKSLDACRRGTPEASSSRSSSRRGGRKPSPFPKSGRHSSTDRKRQNQQMALKLLDEVDPIKVVALHERYSYDDPKLADDFLKALSNMPTEDSSTNVPKAA